MTQVSVLEARRDTSGGYKVDVGRGERIGRVSSEWFSRPADERYLSLSELARSVRDRADRSRTRMVESALIHVEANRSVPERLALILPGTDTPIAPTHWSFGQLASLVGAPAAYLRQLPAPLAAINLQYGLTSSRAEQIKTLETDNGRVELRAVTGPDYGRIYDHELVEAVQRLDRARLDLQRREALVASGSVSEEELTAARNAHSTALANYQAADAARAQAAANRTSAIGSRDANRALIETRAGADNPEVLAARAARDQARVDLERTVLRAPVDGIVSRRQVQVGQRVQAGAMLMIIVPIQAAYVDANFKEGQLKKVRPGQRVTLTSDLYGESVEYHGTVVGFSGGTGAAFAVVPAQNATGNWIKVVQRLPVRIRLDPRQLAEHPLRVGLSMTVDIDVSN